MYQYFRATANEIFWCLVAINFKSKSGRQFLPPLIIFAPAATALKNEISEQA